MIKNVILPIQIITNGNMALASITSSVLDANRNTQAWVDVSQYDDVGIQFMWTGAPVGTITVLASNDGGSSSPTFTTLVFDPVLTQPAGTASNCIAALGLFPFKLIQAVYTRTSGTGTLNAWLMGKGL